MRPGRFHPGNRFYVRDTEATNDASMRPGRFHPGNIASQFGDEAAEWLASMRPGRFHPGNPVELQDLTPHYLMLQ